MIISISYNIVSQNKKILNDLALMNNSKVSVIIESTNQFWNSVENYKSPKNQYRVLN